MSGSVIWQSSSNAPAAAINAFNMNFTCSSLTGVHAESLDRFFGIKNVLMRYTPGDVLLRAEFEKIAQQVHDFEVRKDDIWLVSFPRTGSTWCQEMIWLIGNDLDFDGAKQAIQLCRAPIIELSAVLVTEEYGTFIKEYGKSIDLLQQNRPPPRYIKSHLPIELLPAQLDIIKPKIIYIARDPKDTCVSYYHYLQLIHNFNSTFEEFCELFLNDMVPVAPLFPHYLSFWNKRNESNVLFLKYETMARDLKEVIIQTSKFLEKPLTKTDVEELHEYLLFNNIKNNRAANEKPIVETQVNYMTESKNGSMRNGEVGAWKNYMSPKLSAKFDDWIAKNTSGTDLHF